ncbi:MAG: hypothetical protein AAGJ09_15690, partial [Pseudomonadota bacterium]
MALKTTLPGANTARKMGMVVGTFAVAMGIGFFMQQQDVSASLNASQRPATAVDGEIAAATAFQIPQVAAEQEKVAAAPSRDALPSAVPSSNVPSAQVQDIAPDAPVLMPVSTNPMVTPEDAPSGSGVALSESASCDPTLAARVRDAALVELSVTAACAGEADFTIHHEGMMFSGRTSSSGEATIIAPALSESAVFIAAFDGGLGAVAEADVPAMGEYDRIVLQWRGEGGFEIHAMEYGANYGEDGHVWHDAPRSASSAATGEGGFLMMLGDGRVTAPRFAQVYTFPTNSAPKPGRIALSVEAEITPANCSTNVEAQTLERHAAGAGVKIVDLMLSVPTCDTIGDYLVLKNILS